MQSDFNHVAVPSFILSGAPIFAISTTPPQKIADNRRRGEPLARVIGILF
ncbi:hypothetical protein [Mesorhizobium sp.]|nr:hypothetical protein [Mesorhizobium sp.]